MLRSNPSPHVLYMCNAFCIIAQFDLTPLLVWSLHPWSLHVPRCCDPCLSLARQPPYTVIGTWWYATINSSLMSGRVTPINSFTAKSFASSSGKPSFDRKWSKSNQCSESFKERRKGGGGRVKHYVERLVLLNIMQEQRRQKFQGRIWMDDHWPLLLTREGGAI